MKIIAIFLLLALSSCTYATVKKTGSETYVPTNAANILNDFPNKPYKQIAIIQSYSVGATSSAAYNELLNKGKSIGADALVLMPSVEANSISAMAIKYEPPAPPRP